MNDSQPVFLQRAFNHRAECRVVVGSNVLEHTDGDKGVIFSTDIAVIILDKFHFAVETFGPGTLPRIYNLLA